MSFFDNAKAVTFARKAVAKLELGGKKIWEAVTYKNWAKFAIDTDGSLYNGLGYMEDYRMSSSGGVSALSGAIHSGYIPVEYGDVIRASGSTAAVGQSGNYLTLYDASFSRLRTETMSNCTAASFFSATYVKGDDGFYTITIDTNKTGATMASAMQNAAYFRISFGKCEPENFVITVNEEIT